MRICFFGSYDPGYPRNRILRDGLRRAGREVVEVRVPEWRAFRRYPALLWKYLRTAPRPDVLFVPEFRHKDVPLACVLKGRRMLVFDPLISRWDTLVGDWRKHAPGSGQARWNRGIDRWSLTHADLVLCDTWAHGRLYEQLGARREALRRVLVGAEDAFFSVGPPRPAPPVHIVYLGGFLPLHGVPVLIDALAMLEEESSRLPEYTVTLFGRGIEWERSRARAERVGLTRIEFPGGVSYSDAPRLMRDAHVALGAFGAGPKAGRVIPHKVYQGLAAGRAVVTGDGEGLREVFKHDRDLIAVPRGDAEALAQALARVVNDEILRRELGASGRRRCLEVGTVERVGASLRAALDGEQPPS